MAAGLVSNKEGKLTTNISQTIEQNIVQVTNQRFGIRKIVLIMCQPISWKIITDFYINEIISEGIGFEYWDISQLLFKRKYDVTDNSDFKEYLCSSFEHIDSLKRRLQDLDLSETVFIPQITYDWKSYKFFKTISQANCHCFFFARGALPAYKAKRSAPNIVGLFNYKLPAKICLKLIQKIKNSYLLAQREKGVVKSFDVLFTAGKNGTDVIGVGNHIDNQNSKIVPINYFDFDTFLSDSKDEIFPRSKYCVFLDEYFIGHPDFKALGLPLVDANAYFGTLNDFFDFIEKEFGVEVIIATHPKSGYKENPFNGRKTVKFTTAQLVKHSEFVICHMSTAISFAILNEKPLLFVSCSAIKSKMPQYDFYIRFFASYLNSAFIYLTDKISSKEKIQLKIDREAYKQYAYNFLTHKSTEQTTTREIFLHFLRSYKVECHA